MKKLAILVCVVAVPYVLANLYFIVSTIFIDGWNRQAVISLLALFVVVLILGLIGAGFGGLLSSALEIAKASRDKKA